MNRDERFFYQAILSLETMDECISFFKDICTPKEIESLQERLKVAFILFNEKLPYREISKQTGVSLATITRVARFLNQEDNQGYIKVLNKLSERHQNS